jgi:hypothetical protein
VTFGGELAIGGVQAPVEEGALAAGRFELDAAGDGVVEEADAVMGLKIGGMQGWQASRGVEEAGTDGVEGMPCALFLAVAEHGHAGVVGEVHKIHEHIGGTTGYLWVCRAFVEISSGLEGGILDFIRLVAGTGKVGPPEVVKVEVVPHFVGDGMTEVVGLILGCGAGGADVSGIGDDAVFGRNGATGEGGFGGEELPGANPNIDVLVGIPGVGAAVGGVADGFSAVDDAVADEGGGCLYAVDACCGETVGVALSEAKGDFHISSQRLEEGRDEAISGVGEAEIAVEGGQLGEDLLIGNIVGGVLPDDVEDDGEGNGGSILELIGAFVLEHVADKDMVWMVKEELLEILLGSTTLGVAKWSGCEEEQE